MSARSAWASRSPQPPRPPMIECMSGQRARRASAGTRATNERPRERSVGGRADAAASRAHEAGRRVLAPAREASVPRRPPLPACRASTRWRGARARSSRGGGYRLGPPLGPPHPRRGARGRSRARDRDRARDRPGVELGAAPQLRGPRGRAEPGTRRGFAGPPGAPALPTSPHRLRPERAKAPQAMPRGTRPAPKTPVGRPSCRPKATGCSPKATTPPPPPICVPRSPRVAARRRVARNRAPNPASPTPTRSTTSAARCRRRTNPGRRSRCSTNACTSTTSVRRCVRSSTARANRCTQRGRTRARAGRARGRTARIIPPAAHRMPTPRLPPAVPKRPANSRSCRRATRRLRVKEARNPPAPRHTAARRGHRARTIDRAPRLVAEVAHVGEDHRDPRGIRRGDHLLVAHRPSRLDDRGHP